MITKEAWLRDEYDIEDLVDEMMEYTDYGLVRPSEVEIVEYILNLPTEGDLAADHSEAD